MNSSTDSTNVLVANYSGFKLATTTFVLFILKCAIYSSFCDYHLSHILKLLLTIQIIVSLNVSSNEQ